MRQDLRSSFRTFLRDTVGDASIAYAIIRFGYATPQALMAVVREVVVAREKTQADSARQTQPITKQSHPELAAAAQKARQEFAQGLKHANNVDLARIEHDTLERWEQELHQRFHSGALRREMMKANEAFGHGVGVEKSLSIEQMETLEISWQGH